ncbi:hypothetical protein TRAPUB_4267 [Trametes pubescens]|uniref:Uncharacterized protein n=1 Tax=Trametes pubescens TaxID=154538 RepID=A0A1M2VBJ8_TRAPU|nr:hypothetical protein TRAPUB_4267 [Trametes pubescens]
MAAERATSTEQNTRQTCLRSRAAQSTEERERGHAKRAGQSHGAYAHWPMGPEPIRFPCTLRGPAREPVACLAGACTLPTAGTRASRRKFRPRAPDAATLRAEAEASAVS